MNESKEFLGDTEVTVRFDYGMEHRGPNGERWEDAEVFIQEVVIGGVAVSAEFIEPAWLEKTENLILAEKGRSLQAEAEMAAWEAHQERLMEEGYP